MKRGNVEYAERQALNQFDRWNDVTGVITKHSSYYYEIQGVIEDAVHIGIQMALKKEIHKDDEGNIMKGDY